MENYIASLEKIIKRRLSIITPEAAEYQAILDIAGSFATTAACNIQAATELWESFRESSDATNFFLDTAAEFRFRNDLPDEEWKQFTYRLAQMICMTPTEGTKQYSLELKTPNPINYEIVDNVISDRILPVNEAALLYYLNPWYVVLVLLTFSDILEMFPVTKASRVR